MSNCMPHVPVVGTMEHGVRRDPMSMPSVVCGKCWRRVHPFLEVQPSLDDSAIRRIMKRGRTWKKRRHK